MKKHRANKVTWCRRAATASALAISAMAATAVQPGGIAAQGKQWHGGVTRVDTVAAPALRANLIGDPHRREATVYLPPGYSRNRSKRYPVIYLLHGFAADHRVFIRGPYGNMNVRISMDSLIEKGAIGEMIVVTPNARNFFDGSFYMNSPVTGNWENFVVHDLVGHVDRKYRTIRSRNSRGIAGHSMGGYGALRIAMRHPDIFSAVYALSPCCLAEMNRPERMAGWKAAVRVSGREDYAKSGFNANLVYALAAAYTPNPEKPPLFADLPYRLEGDSLVALPEVLARWDQGPLKMARSHVPQLRRLHIGFDAGKSDALTDIPANVRALDSLLASHGIAHLAELYDGNHGNRVRSRLEKIVFPFFSRALGAESRGGVPPE
jgi:S-formylglutathione hydrolase